MPRGNSDNNLQPVVFLYSRVIEVIDINKEEWTLPVWAVWTPWIVFHTDVKLRVMIPWDTVEGHMSL